MTATDDPRLPACITLIGRTGAQNVQLRFSDDQEPVVWIAVAEWRTRDGRPVPRGGKPVFATGSGLDPLAAVFQLCEQALDGGQCQHCKKVTGVTLDFDSMPRRRQVCWWQYDPETTQFRRGCEGDQ